MLAEHDPPDTALDEPILNTEGLPPSPPWTFAAAGCIDTLTATALLTMDVSANFLGDDTTTACAIAYSAELHEVAPHLTVVRSSDPLTDYILDAIGGLYDFCLARNLARDMARELGAEPDEAMIDCLVVPMRALVMMLLKDTEALKDTEPEDPRALLNAIYACAPAAFRTSTFSEINGYEPRPVERACLALRSPDTLESTALASDVAACSLGADWSRLRTSYSKRQQILVSP